VGLFLSLSLSLSLSYNDIGVARGSFFSSSRSFKSYSPGVDEGGKIKGDSRGWISTFRARKNTRASSQKTAQELPM